MHQPNRHRPTQQLRRTRTPIVAFLLLLFCVTHISTTAADNKISTKKISDDEFELVLKSTEMFDLESATRLLVPHAKNACGNRYIDFGRYSFDKLETIIEGNDTRPTDTYKLIQQVLCSDVNTAQPTKKRVPILLTDKDRKAVRDKVQQLSEEYFQSLYKKLGDDAQHALHQYFDTTAKAGVAKKDPGPTAKGTQIDLNVHRITIYDNTPEPPSAGVYVAADYDNHVGNAAHHCGYLMWHSNDGEDFNLGRIESSVLSEELANKMGPEKLPAILSELRCQAQ